MNTDDFNRLRASLDRLKVAIATLTGSDISGNGTANTIPLFTAAQTIGNSALTQNAGATLVSSSAFFNIGSAAANGTALGGLRVGQGTAWVDAGLLAGSYGAIWISSTPTTSNFALASAGVSDLYVNAPSASSVMYLTKGNGSYFQLMTGDTTSGSAPSFDFRTSNKTSITAGVNAPAYVFNHYGTHQWATGAIATSYGISMPTHTLTAVAASTITNAYNLFVAAPTASTNITITNNYGLGVSGNAYVSAKLKVGGTTTVSAYPLDVTSHINLTGSIYFSAGDARLTSTTAGVYGMNVFSWNGAAEFNTLKIATSNASGTRDTGAITNYTFNFGTHTTQTVGTNIPSLKTVGSTIQWATGALATQYFHHLSANTVAFVGASTATDVYGLYVEAATAGTNATITNNFGLGVAGHLNMVAGGIRFSDKGIDTTAGDTATINSTAGRFRKDTTGATFTLTNSYITANSIIILTPVQVDATAVAYGVAAGAGSAVITFVAAPTSNFDMNFMVFN